ncbi:MAG: type II secretory pathway, component PulD [Verrucomicrobiota bacterium]
MNTTKLPKSLLVSLAAPVLLAVAVPAINAQSQTETKIRLMADGLRARDSGDLATAKANFEQLLALAPNDVTVQRLLASVNEQAGKSAAPVAPVASAEPVEVVYNPNQPAAVAPAAAASAAPVAEQLPTAEALARDEAARIEALIADAKTQRAAAKKMAAEGNYDGAIASLEATQRTLPANTLTQKQITAIQNDILDVQLAKSQGLLEQGKIPESRAALEAYRKAPDASPKAADAQQARINKAALNPALPPISEASPEFIGSQQVIAALLAKGRSQYIAGDLDGAQETFRELETEEPNSPDAKYFLKRIATDRGMIGNLNREKTRAQLLQEVAVSWQRPGVYTDRSSLGDANRSDSEALLRKLDSIIIPSVNFSNNIEFTRVISTLGALSEEYDQSPTGSRGVSFVLQNPANKDPGVNITLRNPMSLKRILDFIVSNAGFEYEVQTDVVIIRPSSDAPGANLATEFFAVTRSTVTRMTGIGGGTSAPAASADPFAPAPAAGGGGGGGGGEGASLQAFLQQAGVDFTNTPGSSLAYDGASIIVTQTNRNLERIRAILNRYNDVRQVEIEAKFMEVQEGALEELGVQWGAAQRNRNAGSQIAGVPNGRNVNTVNRSLAEAFTGSVGDTEGVIVAPNFFTGDTERTPILNNTPNIPGAAQLGLGAANLLNVSAVLGDFDVTATLRALSQSSGSDLLSAPKVTVLSGNPANIAVAQELRYPQSYGEIQSQVSTGNGTGGVSITAGTPQDFTTRNVGVELNVTPTVEEDDYSISLDLRPKVTEFEGFVEYGGQSVAISGFTTVSVPSGFYQPIFSVREISTKVTVWDGATLVMGGLTREEVRKVNDKVPLLGDIPFLGRAFQSKGETSSKRNLLIFVTANLVSPGGSPKKQNLQGVSASSMFQNPSVVTPAGSDSRIRGQ